jgi:phospholipid/cholesterol/gamma-HCH transport system permease protein
VLDKETGQVLVGDVIAHDLSEGQELVLDFSQTRRMDSMGGAAVIQAAGHARRHQAQITLTGQSEEVAEFLGLVEPALAPPPPRHASEESFFESIGDSVFLWWNEAKDFTGLMVDTIYWICIAPFEGRGFRWNLLMDEINEMGVNAVRIVCLMNFLLGLIIAMLSAKQVEDMGLTLYVSYLIMIGFSRELAAIMTAIVVSARTGAAITAEIATMKVQEEVDALRGMGLNVNQFLVAPKVLALIIVMPCLTALGLISGILGGAFWGVFVLGFQPLRWFTETLSAAYMMDLIQGFSKCFVFAAAIALIGCHNGLRVRGASRGVGLMTTRAVVMDIFMIIVIDIIFAVLFYYLS